VSDFVGFFMGWLLMSEWGKVNDFMGECMGEFMGGWVHEYIMCHFIREFKYEFVVKLMDEFRGE